MKKRLSVFLLALVMLLQLLPAGVMASDEIEIIDPSNEDPMYWEYYEEETQAPILYAEGDEGDEGGEEEVKDTRVTFDDFSTRALQEGETLCRGVDVSYYQKNIDWVAAANDGVEFAIIRGGYRGYGTTGKLVQDAKFADYMRGALEAGIEVGIYVYSQATTVDEAKEEAQFLIDMAKDYDVTLPLVLDFEFASVKNSETGAYETGGRLWNAYKNGDLDKDSAAVLCQAFVDTVEAAGYDGMVYVNPDMAKNYVDATKFSRVWLAHYTGTKEEYRDEETGKFPASYYEGDYEFWQCASKGKVDGISGNVDINFWFRPQPPREPFTDVSTADWFYEHVVYAYENNLTAGTSATTFSPETNTSRGQLVAMLYRMAGKPEGAEEAPFTDLVYDYYKPAVYWAYRNGIVYGRSDTEFDPEADVTREELVAILFRYWKKATGAEGYTGSETSLDKFSDASSVAAYAKNAMIWAVENGIVAGKGENSLAPGDNATRAEIVAILHRYIVMVETREADLQEKLLGMTLDDSILLGLEGTEEELWALIKSVLEKTANDVEPDEDVASAANAMYIYFLANQDQADLFLTADTWTLSADISGKFYLKATWSETQETKTLVFDGETVKPVE